MKNIRLLFTAVLAMSTMAAFADASAICAGRIGNKGGANEAFLRWETNAAGDIVITIYGDEGTSFRDATGMAKADATKFNNSFTIGDGTVSATDIFQRVYTNGATTFTLKLKDGVQAPAAGTVIAFRPADNMTWKTTEDGNAYSKYNFDYLYGSTCENPLPAPANVAIAADGTVTFDAVDGAEDYMYAISLNGVYMAEGYITSGAKVTRPILAGGNYNVEVKARSTAAGFSEYSTPAVWALEAQTPEIGSSEYCAAPFGSGTSAAFHTWETDADGNVNITISGEGTHWRTADAFKGIGNFKVGSAPASLWFEVNYTQNASVYQLKLKDGMSLTPGEQIKYSGTTQWVTAANNDAYGPFNWTYTYGAVCGGLAKPSITAISADSVITISGAGDAYKLNIYYNDELYFYADGVHSGDKIDFPAIAAANYQVTVIATAEGAMDSEESDPYSWALAGREVVLGSSEYCSYEVIPAWYVAGVDPTPWRMYLTWETVNNDVVITITGPDGDEGTSFRSADALGINNFSINGVNANRYFDLVTSDGAKEYRLQMKDGKSLPAGQVIKYQGNLQWRTSTQTNGYTEGTQLAYTYGSVCQSLLKPAVNGINADKVIDIAEVAGAAEYGLKVYLGEYVVYTATVHNGDTVSGFVPRVSTTYQVSVTAKAAGMADSEESDLYNWTLEAVPFEPVPSIICSTAIGEDESAAEMSWNTASNGDIYIEIAGDEGTSWRTNNALTPSGFTIGVAPASVYFDFVGENGTTLFLMQKKEGALVGAGMEINYQGNVQWRTAQDGNAYLLGKNYTYVYGTVCENWEDPTVDPGDPTGLDSLNGRHNSQKIIVNGHLYIIVDGQRFDSTGRLVK